MKKLLLLSGTLLAGALAAQPANDAAARALKARAYELHAAGKFAEAATQFQAYLASGAEDARARFDYAALLVQLNRHADAVRELKVELERLRRELKDDK